MDRVWMLQEMLRRGIISYLKYLEMENWHYDDVESFWLQHQWMEGAFDKGDIAVL